MPKVQLRHFQCNYFYEYFGHDTTVLFSNSLGTDLFMWEDNIDVLSHHFNVLRYDTRGHGQSTIHQDELTIAELGQDVLELLDHLKLDQVIFCGLSMGGLIGQWLGMHHPERFLKIILCNTAAKIGDQAGWNSRIEQVTSKGLSALLEGTATRWFTPSYREKYPEKVGEMLARFAQNSKQGYCACCAAVRDADYREQLFNLEVHTLIISGTKDEVTTVDDGKFLKKKIPVSNHISMLAAHLSNKEQPKEFSKFIIYIAEH